MGAAFPIGASKKWKGNSIKIASRLATTSSDGRCHCNCNRRQVVVPIRVPISHHVCQIPDWRHFLRAQWNRDMKSYDHKIFTGTWLSVLKTLPKGRKFNQDYFLDEVLPWLSRLKGRVAEWNLSSILLSIWTARCAIMLEKAVWNWNITKSNGALAQLNHPTSAPVTFGCLVFSKKT
jgi:hypothetical protein